MNNSGISKIFLFAVLISLSLFAFIASSYSVKAAFDTSDEVITAKVQAKIAASPGLPHFNLKINTANSVVSIQGQVDTAAEANNFVMLTNSIPGVQAVDASGLVVKEPPLTPCPMSPKKASQNFSGDSIINSQVLGLYIREGLINENKPSAAAIHVQTRRGIVYLSGTVPNKAIATKAVILAQTINGVTLVESTLSVKK